MPPRWPQLDGPWSPAFTQVRRRMNFAVHVACCFIVILVCGFHNLQSTKWDFCLGWHKQLDGLYCWCITICCDRGTITVDNPGRPQKKST